MSSRQGPFILLPLRGIILRHELATWPDSSLAVLPVLLAHENRRSRKSYPSQERISILAGIRKESVPEGTSWLASRGWLSTQYIPVAAGRSRIEYTFKYKPYSPEIKDLCFSIPKGVVLNCVWKTMPTSVKRLFLVLQSVSWRYETVRVADSSCWYEWEDAMEEGGDSWRQFIDSQYLIGRELDAMTGLSERTRRWATKWLEDVGLLRFTQENEDEPRPGAVIEDASRLQNVEAMDRLKQIRTAAVPREAKSMITQRRKAQREATASHPELSLKTGGSRATLESLE